MQSSIVSKRIDVRWLRSENTRAPRPYDKAYEDLSPRRGDIAAALHFWGQEAKNLGLDTLAGCLVVPPPESEIHA